jgi:hypothetical protein
MPPPFVGYTSNIKHTHIIPKPSYIRYSLLNILNFSCKKKQSPSYVNHLNKPYFKKTSPRCVPVIRTSTNLGKPGNPRLPDRITVLLHVAVGVPGNNEAIGDLWFSPLKRRNFRSQKNKKRRKQGGAP